MKLLDTPGGGQLTTQLGANRRMSNCMLVQGNGGTTEADTLIGTITLPAGGPWSIYGIFALIARQTATTLESNSGYFFMRATVGDLVPNPSPSKFPIGSDGGGVLVTADAPVDKLHFFDVNYQAPGKAVIELYYHNTVDVTVAPKVQIGIIFGLSIPEFRLISFIDEVDANLTLTTEASIGTITLAERATRITQIGGILSPSAGLTTGEEIMGYFRLASDDVKLEPATYPFSVAIGAGLGAQIDTDGSIEPFLIPVDIPIPGGSRIDVYGKLATALTKAVNAQVYLAYDMG